MSPPNRSPKAVEGDSVKPCRVRFVQSTARAGSRHHAANAFSTSRTANVFSTTPSVNASTNRLRTDAIKPRRDPSVVLGISCDFHDASAAIVRDGEVVAAASEERFSRTKHDASFPAAAIRCCLMQQGLELSDVTHAVFHEKPLRTFERVMASHLAAAPWGRRNFTSTIASWPRTRLRIRHRIRDLGITAPIFFCDHHLSHAASAAWTSPLDRGAVVTVDGVGSWHTTTIGRFDSGHLELCQAIDFPHSLGLFYAAATAYCGFEVNEGEYKLMGLAAYGQPAHTDVIHRHLIRQLPDGSFALRIDGFEFLRGQRMHTDQWARWFGIGPKGADHDPLRYADVAASFQRVTEDVLIGIVRRGIEVAGTEGVVMAGGVALNCAAIRRMTEMGLGPIHVHPAAGDSGASAGAALWLDRRLHPRPYTGRSFHPSLGPEYDPGEISAALSPHGETLRVRRFDTSSELHHEIADALSRGEVVARFIGRMEFGPRALGNRSILASATDPIIAERLNHAVKRRENFRPFAPAILAESTGDYFDRGGDVSPHMNTVAMALPTARETIPGGVHVDGSSRIQTVTAERHPDLWGILRSYQELTGIPAILNTSFNVRGQPIVCSPSDAVNCFLQTELDALAIGPFWVRRVIGGSDDDDAPTPAEQTPTIVDRLGPVAGFPARVLAAVFYYLLIVPMAKMRSKALTGFKQSVDDIKSTWRPCEPPMSDEAMRRMF